MSSSTLTIDDLGIARPSPALLRSAVAHQLGLPADDLGHLEVAVAPVAYDVPAITTLGRWWVRGSVDTGSGPAPWSFFVKAVQAWSRSPFFAHVPEPAREVAAAGYPWRTEACVYRSDLASRLPAGLRMPTAHAVVDLPDEACVLWLGEVPVVDRAWTTQRCARAARLLGRLAASPRVAELAEVGDFAWQPGDYVHGRLRMQVEPILRSPVWQHPLLREHFDDDLHRRVDAVLDRLDDLAEEVDAVPRLTGHGDAAPGNLLSRVDDDGFTLVDFGLWNRLPLGFDLGQLLVGDVVLGRAPADRLAEVDAAIVPAYRAGLHDEGTDVDEQALRRAHALELVLYRGLSALPFELLDGPPAAVRAAARSRAALTTYTLDLLDATERPSRLS